MTANNNDVLHALSSVIECRSHRRGRKPQWNILIWTDEKGTVHITDLVTGCKSVVGKRAYKKRDKVKNWRKHVKVCDVPDVKEIVDSSDVRISPRTGKPVRAYKKRDKLNVEVSTDGKVAVGGTVINEMRNDLVNELKALIATLKVQKEGFANSGNNKMVTALDTKIAEMQRKLDATMLATK